MLLDGLHAGLALDLAAPLEAALAVPAHLTLLPAHAVAARPAQLLARAALGAAHTLAALPGARSALGAGPACGTGKKSKSSERCTASGMSYGEETESGSLPACLEGHSAEGNATGACYNWPINKDVHLL